MKAGKKIAERSARTSRTLNGPALVDAFLDAAVPRPDSDHRAGSLAPARAILREHPDLAGVHIFTACVAGNAAEIRRLLREDASLARTPGGPRNWAPLCYLTFSRFLRDEKDRAADFVKCAKLLLAAGADANSYWPSPHDPDYRETALYGAAGIANCAPLVRVLLAVGADPSDDETLYHVAEFSDHRALRLILQAKPPIKWISYCMCHKMDMEDPAGLKLFLKHGADANLLIDHGLFKGYRPLHFAIFRRRSLTIIRLLLAAGADPDLPASNGFTPYQLARRLGQSETANLLLSRGAKKNSDELADFVAALASGDAQEVRRMCKGDASLPSRLTAEDHKLLVDAADAGNVAAVRLMLDVGFPIEARHASYGGWDATALHHAAWNGHPAVIRLLLDRGANPRAQHGFGGDALGAAIHGASHAGHRHGSKVVELLAMKMKKAELKRYLDQAKTEPNAGVVKVLQRLMRKG